LICLRGKIYQIDNDFTWVRDDRGIYGVGSGSSYALGALARATLSPTNTRTAANEARKSIEISISFDINTGGKVKVITQRENQMSAKGEKYKSMAAKKKHEKMEGPAMRKKEYGSAKMSAPKKMGKKK
jgi:hypothetical protein